MRQLLKIMNYAAQLLALIDIGKQANSIIGLVCFSLFCLRKKQIPHTRESMRDIT